MSTFTGFSEEDLKRIKSESIASNDYPVKIANAKISSIGSKVKRPIPQYKLPILEKNIDDDIDTAFDNCKLSLKSPTANSVSSEINGLNENVIIETHDHNTENTTPLDIGVVNEMNQEKDLSANENGVSRKNSSNVAPDVIRCVDNYTEDELAAHRLKLEELQIQQKLMEEQNKKRKEMLAKALADRTKQTEEEVLKLEKIKKELQVLDGQFSQDVAVLRKKIDQACVSFADAEKHYLKIEKEFLQAKINLQKEREKKELLTEHLCALITHNETRKAQKLETLMLELASEKNKVQTPSVSPIIIDGVDERTGKIVEISPQT
ncbi:RAB6-interacting golgin like protein [Danaus plexippus plexippus]|uniref:RAB6-interacting golgin n=1 Tax=Danaus plexippus plexippus TaxID=278856 RepID=A0A212EQ49_DANPL|nr:RAB6-interacting golgin like protein [Danaus plexippus plexippus]